MAAKKAQIQITFHWIYVLIAGTVILLFFFSLVAKQKTVSEENLANDLLQVMESIFSGASVSESTKNIIDTSGLTNYQLYFSCDEGVGEYGIKDTSSRIQDSVYPIFAPLEVQSSQLLLWSLPYELPFKVMDLLMIASANTKYILLGDADFAAAFQHAVPELDVVISSENNLDSLAVGRNTKIRLIDLDNVFVSRTVPINMQQLDDSQVSAVAFSTSSDRMNQVVDFYQKQGSSWQKLNRRSIPLIDLKKDRSTFSPTKIAAIFAGDADSYSCSMQKVFKRLGYLNVIYAQKINDLEEYYQQNPSLRESQTCENYINKYTPQLKSSFLSFNSAVRSCLSSFQLGEEANFCHNLAKSADEIKEVNKKLAQNSCLTLY